MRMRTVRFRSGGLQALLTALLAASVFLLSAKTGFAEASAAEPGAALHSARDQEQDRQVYESLQAGHRADPKRTYERPERPTVYLTFDDGPSKLTGQILDILKEEGVKATFFVIGQQAERQGEAMRRIAEEGHAIGNHSYNHVYKELYGNFSDFWEQIRKSEAIIEKQAGIKPELIRAPGGTATNFDAFYFYLLEKAGYTVFDWNVDSGDAVRQGVPAADIVQSVRQSPLASELVVLMHDGTGHEQTVKALPDIIRFYKEKGYAFASLSPSVKPVQFPVGKNRWHRSMSLAAFEGWLKQADEAAGARTEQQLEAGHPPAERENGERFKRQAQLAAEEARAGPERQALTPLSVMLDAGLWVMEPGQYEFRYDRFAVPLRGLMERIGGDVAWDEQRRVAVVRLGGKIVEYDPIGRTVSERLPGGSANIHHMADVRLVNGEIRVPLRATVELFGGHVNGYQVTKDVRSVAVNVSKSSLLVQIESVRALKSFNRV